MTVLGVVVLILALLVAFVSGGLYMDDLVDWLDKRRAR